MTQAPPGWWCNPPGVQPSPVLVSALMARRSLRPELNRIRAWVRQGRTDAWIAHQLEVTVQQIQAFKREQGLEAGGEAEAAGTVADYDDEIDLRAEDDALIAAELEAAEAERAEEEDDELSDATDPTRTTRTGRRVAGAAAAVAVAGADARRPRARSRPPSTTARRATACGSTPPSRTTRSTPSTGPATGRSRSRSRRTRS